MAKQILILGGDGYLGWPLAMSLARQGQEVTICDNFNKRKWELEIGVKPLIQLPTLHERVEYWNKHVGVPINVTIGDVTNQRFIYDLFSYKPDVVIHCADQPSSPFSMKGINTAQITQSNNLSSGLNILFAMKKFCPDSLYVRLGASALADFDNIRNHSVNLCNSYYELSKLHDCNNISFAVDNWGLRSVVVNTGVIYNDVTEETVLGAKLKTSLHYDRVFGTVVNRFCVQAVLGIGLTIYGSGEQLCALSSLQSAINSIAGLSLQENVSSERFQICNSYEHIFSVKEIAEAVKEAGSNLGMSVDTQILENPRKEKKDIKNKALAKCRPGAQEAVLNSEILEELLKKIIENKNNILPETILPTIKWAMK